MSENQSREVSSDVHPQEELPLAVVQGKAIESLPQDLYIPPEALQVFLEAFDFNVRSAVGAEGNVHTNLRFA